MKPVTLFAMIVAGVIVGTLAVRGVDALRIATQHGIERQELHASQYKFIDALTSAGFLQRVECEGQQVAYVYGGSAFSSYPDDPQRDERLSLIWHYCLERNSALTEMRIISSADEDVGGFKPASGFSPNPY